MKRHLFIVMLLASLMILAGCNGNDVTKTGSLRLAAKFDGAKTIMPSSGEITCASYKVVGTFVNDASNTLNKTFTGNTVRVDNMLVGPWLVYVEGYNANGILIAKSESQTITIKAGTTESSVFELGFLQNGTGYVDVCVHVPFGNTSIDSAVMTLSTAGSEDIVVALEASVSASDYSFICHEEIPVGNYSASFDFADAGSNQLG